MASNRFMTVFTLLPSSKHNTEKQLWGFRFK